MSASAPHVLGEHAAQRRPSSSDLLRGQARGVVEDDLERLVDGEHGHRLDVRTMTRRAGTYGVAAMAAPWTFEHRESWRYDVACGASRATVPTTVEWDDDAVVMIDQRRLPAEEVYLRCRDHREVAAAIRTWPSAARPPSASPPPSGIALGVRRSKTEGDGAARASSTRSARTCASRGRPRSTSSGPSSGCAARFDAGAAAGGAALRDALAGRGPRHPRRGHRRLPAHGRPRGRAHHAAVARPHPLQRGRPGHRRLRHGARRDPLRGARRARSRASSPTRRGPTCRARGSPPGS